MFVQKIFNRVFCVNVKHSSFRPSRPFFGKCNLFVLIVNAIPGRNFLVLNFSPRSKRFRASSLRKLGREQKIVMRREEEERDGKDHGVCGQAFPLLPSPSPLHFKFAFAATFAQQFDWKRLLCTLNFASLRKHTPFSTLFRKLEFFFLNHLPIPWNDRLSHVIQSVKQSEFRVRIWIRLVSINHGLRTGYKTRTSNYVLGKAYNGLYSKNSSWKVKGKETDCG